VKTFILAGAGPGLLSSDSINLMRLHETIGVNTTVKYPEVKPLLDHWITCDGRMMTPGNEHYIVDYLKDCKFDKYVFSSDNWDKYCVDIPGIKLFKNTLTGPFGGYPDGTLALGWNNTVMTGAASLAKHLGATECVLVGSDYMGVTKQDGSLSDDDMNVARGYAEKFFHNLGIPVYKTNPKSPIKLRLYENKLLNSSK